MFDSGELHTETFSNSQGWTVVRVTHVPTGVSAERERTEQRASSVQAQSECITELRDRIRNTDNAEVAAAADDSPVTRAELDALVARVAALESQMAQPPRS